MSLVRDCREQYCSGNWTIRLKVGATKVAPFSLSNISKPEPLNRLPYQIRGELTQAIKVSQGTLSFKAGTTLDISMYQLGMGAQGRSILGRGGAIDGNQRAL